MRRLVNTFVWWIVCSGAAMAQVYPSKPITIIVPSVPGGNIDGLARSVAQPLSRALGQSVVVVNRPGASMVTGAQAVATAPADGYTLLFGSSTALAMNAVVLRKIPYDPLASFSPVSLIAVQPMVILVHPSVAAQTLPEFVSLAKSKPSGMFYGSTGSSIQLATEYFNNEVGIRLDPVPYKGNADGLIELAGGRIQLLFDVIPTATPFIESGRARALAVTAKNRSAALPNVPTVSELGLPSGFDINLFFALMAPAGTPAAVVGRLNEEIRKILVSSEMKEQLARQGVESSPSTSAQLHDRISSEISRWKKVMIDANIAQQE